MTTKVRIKVENAIKIWRIREAQMLALDWPIRRSRPGALMRKVCFHGLGYWRP